jgi:K+-sensing histidine kinase KdpD
MARTYSFEALGLLHGSMDESLYNIIALASQALDVPISFVSVLEKEEGIQYLSAYLGSCFDESDTCEMPVEGSICRYVQADRKTVAIPDLLKDPRTHDNEFVLQHNLRAYLGSPVHTVAGKVIGAICCMSYAPREWRPNEIGTLECLARCVDDLIAAKTSTLEEHKLRMDLQEMMETRSGYVAHVSHEIRTPLTGIVGSIKLLQAAKFETQSQSLMSILDRSADRLLDFVNDVLDLAKLDAGHFETIAEVTEIGELAGDVLSEFQSIADAKSLNLTVDDRLNGKNYLADRAAFKTILQNLIGNAVKFTETGAITVSIDEDSYGQLSIRVTDTGIGIAPENHEKIFKEFQQAEPATARTYGGTGLGMPIVKRMVDRMNGTISVKSELGKGSTFTVLVPLQADIRGELAA